MAIQTINSTDNGANSLIKINDNFTDLDTTKADLASPTFTGTPSLPTGTTAVTQSPGDNSTKIATTAFVNTAASPITIETTTGTTHSLTTTANQKVIVWAKGNNAAGGDSSAHTYYLNYNSVQKDIVVSDGGTGDVDAFSLMYTETPGAGTYNITVTSTVSIENVKIIVMKIG